MEPGVHIETEMSSMESRTYNKRKSNATLHQPHARYKLDQSEKDPSPFRHEDIKIEVIDEDFS